MQAPHVPLTAHDVLLVPGGARGITPHCLREIAKRARGITFVLLGRSALATPPGWASDVKQEDLQKAATAHLKSEMLAKGGAKVTPMAVKALVKLILYYVVSTTAVDGTRSGEEDYLTADRESNCMLNPDVMLVRNFTDEVRLILSLKKGLHSALIIHSCCVRCLRTAKFNQKSLAWKCAPTCAHFSRSRRLQNMDTLLNAMKSISLLLMNLTN